MCLTSRKSAVRVRDRPPTNQSLTAFWTIESTECAIDLQQGKELRFVLFRVLISLMEKWVGNIETQVLDATLKTSGPK